MRLEDARSRKVELCARLDRVLRSDPLGEEVALAQAARPVAISGRSFADAFVKDRRRGAPLAAVSVGLRPRTSSDFGMAVRVQTARPRRELVDRLRGLLEEDDVDVRIIGQVKAQRAWYRDVTRPLRLGASVGHIDITAGTIGSFVSRNDTPGTYILSNNHVLANVDQAEPGDPVLQPGPTDNPAPGQLVAGRFSTAVPIDPEGINTVDCAVAEINDGIDIEAATVWTLGQHGGPAEPYAQGSSMVAKIGRTTGLTWGRISAIELDPLEVDMGRFVAAFGGQIEVEGTGTAPFSQGGDSGSIVLDMDLNVVGLLFAGSTQGGANGRGLTYVNPMSDVLSTLNATLIT